MRGPAPEPDSDPDGKGACAASFREETRRIFVDIVQRFLISSEPPPAPRPVFRKLHGVARGRLILDEDMPDRFRHGVLAHRQLAAWVRFSSDTVPDTPDAENSTLGIGIKLFGMDAETLDSDDPHAGTADLLLQNHDRFFVDDGQAFCAFSAAAVGGRLDAYIADHPETGVVLAEMAKPEASVLTATYWSVLPYACGPEAVVKYRLQPAGAAGRAEGQGGPNPLRDDLRIRLQAGPAVFDLSVQVYTREAETPLDAATRRWATPFLRIGTLVLEQQDVTRAGQAAYGENLSIHPWRVPPENRPLGSIADARRIAYPASAHLRRTVNGVPIAEPSRPR